MTEALKRAWQSATRAERKKFLQWVNAEVARKTESKTTSSAPAPAKRGAPGPLTGKDGRLSLKTIKRIETLMRERRLTAGKILEQMGYSRFGSQLSFAMSRANAWRPTPAFLTRLADWLAKAEKA